MGALSVISVSNVPVAKGEGMSPDQEWGDHCGPKDANGSPQGKKGGNLNLAGSKKVKARRTMAPSSVETAEKVLWWYAAKKTDSIPLQMRGSAQRSMRRQGSQNSNRIVDAGTSEDGSSRPGNLRSSSTTRRCGGTGQRLVVQIGEPRATKRAETKGKNKRWETVHPRARVYARKSKSKLEAAQRNRYQA